MLFLLILAILIVWIIGKFFTAVAAAIIIAGIVLALIIKGMSSREFREDMKKIGAEIKRNPKAIGLMIIFVIIIGLLLAAPYIYELYI